MAAVTHAWQGKEAFRSAAELMPGMVWTARPDGALDWANASFCAYVGDAPDLVAARGLNALLHAEDASGFAATWAASLAGSTRLNATARLRAADGSYRWHLVEALPASADGSVAAWIGSAADVHAPVTAADALARDNEELEQDLFRQLHALESSRSRLQTIFDACPDYLYLMRLSGDGTVTFEDINPAAEALCNAGRADVVGRTTAEVASVEPPADIAAHVRQALRDGRIDYRIERRADAAVVPLTVQVVGAAVAYSNEEEGLVLFCGRDITEQRAAEEALRQSQKMEAVGQLTGGLAHDFNNLLTGIMGSLDLMDAHVAKGRYERVPRYVKAAQEAAGRAAALTHRLLAFSRRQTLDPKPADANELVAGMADLLGRTVGPEIALRIVPAPELWTVLVDVSQLENALLNLCINARDALSGGGRITVETRNARLAAEEAGDLQPGEYIVLSVSDNGTGIPPGIVARIFDPFFTTKPVGAGTGLGLSMIYGFARQSGGDVRVDTRLGAGTTMRLLLPRHAGAAQREPPRLAPGAPRAGRDEGILLVDDEHTVRSLAREMLEDLGYRVTVAGDGAGGLALLRADAHVDVLITDVGLPGGLNGRQVAEAARALRPGLKVLFITGYAEHAVLNHGHLAPGTQVLTKPFPMELLATRLRALIEHG